MSLLNPVSFNGTPLNNGADIEAFVEIAESTARTTDISLTQQEGDFPTVSGVHFRERVLRLTVRRGPNAPTDRGLWADLVNGVFDPHIKTPRMFRAELNGTTYEVPAYIGTFDRKPGTFLQYAGTITIPNPTWIATAPSYITQLFDNFERPNGAPGTATTGHVWTQIGPAGAGQSLPVITGGALTAPDSAGGGSTVAAISSDAHGTVTAMSAIARWAAGTSGGQIDLVSLQGLSPIAPHVNDALFVFFSDTIVQTVMTIGGVVVAPFSYVYAVPVVRNGSTQYTFGWSLDLETSMITITAPDGAVVTHTDSRYAQTVGDFAAVRFVYPSPAHSKPSVLSVNATPSAISLTGNRPTQPIITIWPDNGLPCAQRTFTIKDRCTRGVFDYQLFVTVDVDGWDAAQAKHYDLYFNGRRIPFTIMGMNRKGGRLVFRVDLPPMGFARIDLYYGANVDNPLTSGAWPTPNVVTTQAITDALWTGYFVKPAVTAGIADPFGGTGAYQLASAGANTSGILFGGIGTATVAKVGRTYTVSGWLRVVSGTLPFSIGLDDVYAASLTATTAWRFFAFTFTVTVQNNGRVFQMLEQVAANPAWQVYDLRSELNSIPTNGVDPSQYNMLGPGIGTGETGLTGIGVAGSLTPTVDTTVAHSGTASIKLVSTVLGVWWMYYRGDVITGNVMYHGLIAGETYTFSLRVFVPSGYGLLLSNVQITINDYDGALELGSVANPTKFDEWEKISVTRTIRATATSAYVRVVFANQPVGAPMWTDDPKLEIGSLATDQFDGGSHQIGPYDPAGMAIGHPNITNERLIWDQTRLTNYPSVTQAWKLTRLGRKFPNMSATFVSEPTFVGFTLLANQSGDEDVDGMVIVTGVECAGLDALRNVSAVLAGTAARRVKYRKADSSQWLDATVNGANWNVPGAVQIAFYVEATSETTTGTLEIYSFNGKFLIGSSPWELLLDASRTPQIVVGAPVSTGILRGQITNLANGDYIDFDDVYLEATAGKTLIIDTVARKLTPNGKLTGSERIAISNSDQWMVLVPQESNIITKPDGIASTVAWNEALGT